MKLEEESRSGVLCDDFRDHSTTEVKNYVKTFKSGNENDDEDDRNELLDWNFIVGGITPKAQPQDLTLIKIMKRHCRNFYNVHMIDATVNPYGNPIVPSRQLCATWVVQAWDMVP